MGGDYRGTTRILTPRLLSRCQNSIKNLSLPRRRASTTRCGSVTPNRVSLHHHTSYDPHTRTPVHTYGTSTHLENGSIDGGILLDERREREEMLAAFASKERLYPLAFLHTEKGDIG